MTTESSRRRRIAKFKEIRLYVLVTAKFCRQSPLQAAEAAIQGGAGAIQLREKELSDRELLELARRFQRLCASRGALFIMNDRPDLARLSRADGVHLGQDDLTVADARRILHPGQIVGVSTHCVEQARQAVADGADYLGVGPVFPTATKGYEQGVGLTYVRDAARAVDLPFVALGGVTADNAGQVAEAGAPAVAVCSAVVSAPDPADAARRICAAVAAARQAENRRS